MDIYRNPPAEGSVSPMTKTSKIAVNCRLFDRRKKIEGNSHAEILVDGDYGV